MLSLSGLFPASASPPTRELEGSSLLLAGDCLPAMPIHLALNHNAQNATNHTLLIIPTYASFHAAMLEQADASLAECQTGRFQSLASRIAIK